MNKMEKIIVGIGFLLALFVIIYFYQENFKQELYISKLEKQVTVLEQRNDGLHKQVSRQTKRIAELTKTGG